MFGFGDIEPMVVVEKDKFKLIVVGKPLSSTVEKDILPSHQNKQLMLRFVAEDNKFQVALYQGFFDYIEEKKNERSSIIDFENSYSIFHINIGIQS